MTDRQKRFAHEYMVDFNATQAAIRAGYAEKSARISGCVCMKNIKIKQEITVIQAEYEQARLLAIQLKQPAAAVSAITGKARLHGMDKDAGAETQQPAALTPEERLELKRLSAIKLKGA